MDVTGTYCRRLHDALRSDPEELGELLRRRWTGDDGPALDDDPSWTSLLFYAYETTPEELRPRWAKVICDHLEAYPAGRLAKLTVAERAQLLGALELAQGLDWPDDEGHRLDAMLVALLRYGLSPRFPRPRDLWREDRLSGHPEPDLVTALLRLAVRRLDWEPVAEKHWEAALVNTAGLPVRIVAWRLWEIARWAMAAANLGWLAGRLDVLDERLEAADRAPGNLTRLFFLIEFELGPAAVVDLISKALRTLDPRDHQRRQELAGKLDYFGTSNEAIRSRLWRLKTEFTEPIPEAEIPPDLDARRRAWAERRVHEIVVYESRLEVVEAGSR